MKTVISICLALLSLMTVAGHLRAEDITEEWTRIQQGPIVRDGDGMFSSVTVKADRQGNVYVSSTNDGYYAAMRITKYDRDGKQLWVKEYGGRGNFSCFPRTHLVGGDGSLYVTGACKKGTDYVFDLHTFKLDSDGNLLWTDEYANPWGTTDFAMDMAMDSEGNILVVGVDSGEAGNTDVRTYDFVTIKYDRNGNRSWAVKYDAGPAKMWNGNVVDSCDIAHAVAADAEGNVYVTGRIQSYHQNPETIYVTVKYDEFGHQQWVKTNYLPVMSPVLFGSGQAKIAVDDEGACYVFGNNALIKYDGNGDVLWKKNYYEKGATTWSRVDAAGLALGPSGDVHIGGTWLKSYPNYGWEEDYLVAKYSREGTLNWQIRYDGPLYYYDIASSLALDSQGSVYITGYTPNGPGIYDYNFTTVKYDASGSKEWAMHYTRPSNAEKYMSHPTIDVDADGSIYVAGKSKNANEKRTVVLIKYGQPSFNAPPFADAGPDQAIEMSTCAGAIVTLDGSGSSDSNSDPLSYAWTWTGGSASGASPQIALPYGTHKITLTVDDGKGGTSADTVVITIVDTTSPMLSVALSPDLLWPPNHRAVTVTPSFAVTDACVDAVVVERISSSSNEPDNGLGDGDTAGDIVIHDDGTLSLRAERSGAGNGREYSITYRATDIAGNTATATAIVQVPHDRGK